LNCNVIKNEMMNKIIFFITLFVLLGGAIVAQNERPCVAFSFDDGNPRDILTYKGDDWNALILGQLKQFDIKVVWFVAANKLDNEKGKLLLEQWNNAGHLIANHTYSHLNYNKPMVSCNDFVREIKKCDSLINGFSNYQKIFRFPVLKAGNTITKHDSIQNWLLQNGYKQGWVTIDASDWYYNQRLIRLLKEKPDADLCSFRDAFVSHIFDRALYYNKLSVEINHRQITHTLLLHFNLTSALFLSDLIAKFKKEGWNIVDYSEAMKDPVYSEQPNAMPSEQSLIWMQAKQTGRYENQLRYPGEDGDYEKEKLDRLGL
jgi:peptidoglycan-N-acetylglucosamine deacetylase